MSNADFNGFQALVEQAPIAGIPLQHEAVVGFSANPCPYALRNPDRHH